MRDSDNAVLPNPNRRRAKSARNIQAISSSPAAKPIFQMWGYDALFLRDRARVWAKMRWHKSAGEEEETAGRKEGRKEGKEEEGTGKKEMPVTRHRGCRPSPADLARLRRRHSYLVKGLASAQDISPLTTPSRVAACHIWGDGGKPRITSDSLTSPTCKFP